MENEKIDGREAYRDDPDYTAPEMQPSASPDGTDETIPPEAGASAAGLSIGAAGGAFAGQVLADEFEAEREATTMNPPSPDEEVPLA